ncbi:MAG TPA: hypothetical protein VMI52_10330 [Acetobacteraceae bacterium]|nr:hypothetical protein [Acetobacteraceae bacterium]
MMMIPHDVRRFALAQGMLAPQPAPLSQRAAGQPPSRPERAYETLGRAPVGRSGGDMFGPLPGGVCAAPER